MLILSRIGFITFLIFVLNIKSSIYMLYIIPILWLFSYKEFFRLNKKVIKSILFFNLGITLGYILISYLKNESFYEYVFYIDLKVYLLTYFVIWFFRRIDIVGFFAFSKDLSYLLSISLSQIYSYRKSLEDLVLAYRTRVISKIYKRDRLFVLRLFDFFMQKSMKDAKQRALAMRARGFFD